MKLILPFLILLPFFMGFSQGPGGRYYIDFNTINVPESPVAASLGSYGDIPVNTATGVPNINIPLYTLEVDGLSIPISLSYHASGVKVNDISTAVGLKWTLQAGGGIFRTIKSKPDEEGWRSFNWGPFPDSHYEGWVVNDFDYQMTFQQEMMGNFDGGPFRGLASMHDHNPDEYSYSFLGWSGEYITDRYGEPIKIQNDKLLIDTDWSNPFIEDQTGNTYYFGGHQETSNRKYTYGSAPTAGGDIGHDGYDIDGDVVTGWMIDSISTKNDRKIYFDYDPYTIMEYTPHIVANHLSYTLGCSSGPFAERSTTSVTNDYTVQLIKEIRTDHIKIEFTYDTESSLSIWQKRLRTITINDLIGGGKREYYLEYAQFSGNRLQLKKVFEVGYKNNVAVLKEPYVFWYESPSLPNLYDLSQDFFGYYNGKSNTSLAPKSDEAEGTAAYYGTYHGVPTNFYYDNTGDRSLNANTVDAGVLNQIRYPTGGVTDFTYEPNAEYDPVTHKYTKYCGGLRVAKIENRVSPTTSEVAKSISYIYEDLYGDDFESNIYKTVKHHYDQLGSIMSTIYNSSFVVPGGVYSGYFYKKVTTLITANGQQQKKEDQYELNLNYGKYDFFQTAERIYSDGGLSKLTEYEYESVGIGKDINWNILGNMRCIPLGQIDILGYGPGSNTTAWGNIKMLPTQIATTDFLKMDGSAAIPVTTVQFISYDDDTLLKTIEMTSSRWIRQNNGTLELDNPDGEDIITYYTYPWSPGVDVDLPLGLPIGKQVVSSESTSDEIFGQFFEYDDKGNIKRTFQYNKGAVGNTSSPDYIETEYEEMATFTYAGGKPVQVSQKSGEATSYIWGLNGQFPVAKIEGKTRAGINQSKLQAVENASYGQLPTALSQLRADATLSGAMVTTYTYEPLNGVKTITDPKGDTVTFFYDAFGRLEMVKDKDGKILSENEYHYRSQ